MIAASDTAAPSSSAHTCGVAEEARNPPTPSHQAPTASQGDAAALVWAAAARAALASGEWREAYDAQHRKYFYEAATKKPCWNLAKELQRRAAAPL